MYRSKETDVVFEFLKARKTISSYVLNPEKNVNNEIIHKDL